METITYEGIEISKFDVTDANHPIGYAYNELAGLIPPAGYEHAEPNTLMYLHRKGVLPNVTMSGYVYQSGIIQIPGRITMYASKCRNDFHPVLLRPPDRAAFNFYPNIAEQKLFKVRWVKAGCQAPKIAFSGMTPVKWQTFSDNLKIYLGYMNDPNIPSTIPLGPLNTGINNYYLFPESYDGYRIDLFVADNPLIETIYDEDGLLYFAKTSHGNLINYNFIQAEKYYTIVVE